MRDMVSSNSVVYTTVDDLQSFSMELVFTVPCVWLWLFSGHALRPGKSVTAAEQNSTRRFYLNAGRWLILIGLIKLDATSLYGFVEAQSPAFLLTLGIFKIASLILVAVMLKTKKRNAISKSSVLSIFWMLMTVIALPICLNADTLYPSTVYFLLCFLMLTLHYIPDVGVPSLCTSSTSELNHRYSPELMSSFLQQITYQWFSNIIWTSFRQPLADTKLWNLNPAYCSNMVSEKFEKHFAYLRRIGKANSIVPILIRAHGKMFALTGAMRLALMALYFLCPEILRELIKFTENNAPLSYGFILVYVIFIVSCAITLLQGQYTHCSYVVGLQIRSSIINFVYKKLFRLSTIQRSGEILNHISEDVDKFIALTANWHMLWSAPLTIVVCIYLLWQVLGAATMFGVAVMVLLIPVNIYIANNLKAIQIDKCKATDERIKWMEETLNGIKVVKLYAWETAFIDIIDKIRNTEMSHLKAIAFYNAIKYFSLILTPFLVSLLSFTMFVFLYPNEVLTVEIAFYSITLFNIMRFPLAILSTVIISLMQCWVAIGRINHFIGLSEHSTVHDDVATVENDEYCIVLKNASFSDGKLNSEEHLNFEIRRGTCTAIFGDIGSGKSRLLLGLVGAIAKTNGSVNVTGTVAYVSQIAWMCNGTVRDNIIFGRSYDVTLFEQVISTCLLDGEINKLIDKEHTIVEENGVNLSGGQKQRIALARALYSQADVYFLDDPFSACDRLVGAQIVRNILGDQNCKGLLYGKTVLFVTHDVNYLATMDDIIVLEDGRISGRATYEEFRNRSKYFMNFNNVVSPHVKPIDFERDLSGATISRNDEEETEIPIERVDKEQDDESTVPLLANEKVKNVKNTKKTGKATVPIEQMSFSRKVCLYVRYCKYIGLLAIVCLVLLNVTNQAAAICSTVWLSQWSSDVNATESVQRNYYVTMYSVFGIVQALSLFLICILTNTACLSAATKIHRKLLSHVMRLPLSFFDGTLSGETINRFSQDLSSVDNILPISLRDWLNTFSTLIGILMVFIYSSPLMVIVIVIATPVYLFIIHSHLRVSNQLRRFDSRTKGAIFSTFRETIAGLNIIKAYKMESIFIQKLEESVDCNSKFAYFHMVTGRWLAIRLELIGIVVLTCMSFVLVQQRDKITGAIMGLALNYALQIIQHLNSFVVLTSSMESNIVAIERIDEYMDVPKENDTDSNCSDTGDQWPSTGRIVFDRFSMSHSANPRNILKSINLEIGGGKKIAVVGRTGAGKTTFALALFRLSSFSVKGTITIDGRDISRVSLKKLRNSLTIVPQDPILFAGSARFNLDAMNCYEDDEIWRIIRMLNLNSVLHELDANDCARQLSVGQKQMLCLARGLLKKSKIVILDEASASVDATTDNLIQNVIKDNLNHCTVISIAHRIQTLIDYDEIIVIDDGLIREHGTPTELFQNQNSYFNKMQRENSNLHM